MDFALMTEPQLGGTYEDLLGLARWAEDQGMVAFARSDHYAWEGDPRDATDAFATLAGLSRETNRIRLCVLVSPITFRHPAVIAKNAATIDQMSGGRLDLGVGTGWNEHEHRVLGLPFWDWSERFERLTETLPYLREAFGSGHGKTEGTHYPLDHDVLPKPEGLRLIVGGTGKRRTPTLAGTYADEYNHIFTTPDDFAPKVEAMRQAATEAGRDPEAVTVSMMGPVFAGRDEPEYRARIETAAAQRDRDPDELEASLHERGILAGTPDRLGETLAALEEVGVGRYYLQWIDLDDRDGLEASWEAVRIATE